MFRPKLSSKEIMKAAKEGQDEGIRKQLKKLDPEKAKQLVNEANEYKETALHIAAGSGQLNFVNLLLEYGANPNAIGIFKETPLHRAAAKNNAELMTALLNAGAIMTMSNLDGQKPIHIACDNGADEVIKVLIAKDPSQVNSTSKENRTPFFYAHEDKIKNILKDAETHMNMDCKK